MKFVKSLIAVVAIAVAVGLQVEAGKDWWDICKELFQEMRGHSFENEEKAYAFAKGSIERQDSLSRIRNSKLINALEDIFNGAQCSESSWMHLVVFFESRLSEFFEKSVQAYANECLNSQYVSEKIKAATSGLFSPDVKFIDAAFIRKFYKDNPDDPSLHVDVTFNRGYSPRMNGLRDWVVHQDCCKPDKSEGAVKEAIERDLTKRGKDPRKYFSGNRDAVTKYLERMLFKPCEKFVSSYIDMALQIIEVSFYYKGGNQALIKSLDQDAKDILFRYMYCHLLTIKKGEVRSSAQKNFA